MILGLIRDPVLRSALQAAARPDESVLVDAADVLRALTSGCPRVLVVDDARCGRGVLARARERDVPTVVVCRDDVANWESRRRESVPPPDRRTFYARCLRALFPPGTPTWVDRTLADLARATGGPLPTPFVGLARRVLEDPAHFTTLDTLSPATGLSPGAMRARFRRRELPSPTDYLRWLRLLAAAHCLRSTRGTVSATAVVLGFHSSGNLARFTQGLVGRSPASLRTDASGAELLLHFAAFGLGPTQLDGWRSLHKLFDETRRARA